MSKVQKWGREESIIWPPRGFYYTYGAIFLALLVAGFLVYVRFAFGLSPLEKYYLPYYLRTDTAGLMHQRSEYQLIYVLNDAARHSAGPRQRCSDGAIAAGRGKGAAVSTFRPGIAKG